MSQVIYNKDDPKFANDLSFMSEADWQRRKMKRYSELNTVELVEANLAGGYDGMMISPDVAIQNLKNLKSMLARELDEHRETYKQVKGQNPRHVVEETADYVEYVEHLHDLMEKLEKAIA